MRAGVGAGRAGVGVTPAACGIGAAGAGAGDAGARAGRAGVGTAGAGAWTGPAVVGAAEAGTAAAGARRTMSPAARGKWPYPPLPPPAPRPAELYRECDESRPAAGTATVVRGGKQRREAAVGGAGCGLDLRGGGSSGTSLYNFAAARRPERARLGRRFCAETADEPAEVPAGGRWLCLAASARGEKAWQSRKTGRTLHPRR